MKVRTLFLGRTTSILIALFIGFFIGFQFAFTFKFPSPSPSSPPSAAQPLIAQQRKTVDTSNDILMTTFESLQALADETRRKRGENGRPLSNGLLSSFVEQLCEKVDVVSQLLDQLNCTKPKHTNTTNYSDDTHNTHNKDKNTNTNKNDEITKNCDCSKNNNNNNQPNSPLEPIQQDPNRKNQPPQKGRHDPSFINPVSPNFAKNEQIAPLENYEKNSTNRKVVIVISTSPSTFKRRSGIRQTWINYLNGTPYQNYFVYKFFLGAIVDPALKKQIEAEQSLFGDIVMLDSFIDTYRNLSYKTIGMMRWAVDNYNTTFVLKLDDDTFLRLDRLIPFMAKIPTERYFVGHSFGSYKPNRDRASRWYVTEEEYPSGSVGPILLAGGGGYLMTKDCAYFVGHRLDDPTYKPLYIEDVNTALILREYGVKGVNNPLFYAFASCTETRMTFHYIDTPEKMNFLYKNSREKTTMCV